MFNRQLFRLLNWNSMKDISAYRLGNNVFYQGTIIKLNENGLNNLSHISPIPIEDTYFKRMNIKIYMGDDTCPSYMFHTSEEDGIVVVFHPRAYIIFEYVSKKGYSFIKHVHELQNLITDKKEELTRMRFIEWLNIKKVNE